jgi:hypothetical protein
VVEAAAAAVEAAEADLGEAAAKRSHAEQELPRAQQSFDSAEVKTEVLRRAIDYATQDLESAKRVEAAKRERLEQARRVHDLAVFEERTAQLEDGKLRQARAQERVGNAVLAIVAAEREVVKHVGTIMAVVAGAEAERAELESLARALGLEDDLRRSCPRLDMNAAQELARNVAHGLREREARPEVHEWLKPPPPPAGKRLFVEPDGRQIAIERDRARMTSERNGALAPAEGGD